ncbi:DHA2 family efflux MFS transporter permease subunit [Actinomadura chibensis]|uniref:Multidrug efflux MFS transporter n=1 Tax=Actinomadura chibensis TaxID=392828 RepID=A0A5D0NDL7_9ACTN|nr:DHA2 family efflux MFS transporter permease subunit [Actinomadura chibensis]TYB42477.1 multidrug efflux MFS transporter [Actinomadura chibensis]
MRASAADRRYPWIVTGVVLFGTYAVAMNLTVLGIALPPIAADLGAGAALSPDWVIGAYFVAIVVVQPAVGALGDRWGRRRLYNLSIGLFAVGSVACTAAPTMTALVAGRVVQGLGGGALMPLATAMVYEMFPPHRRGLALGVWGIATMVAPALGPPVGGWVATAASWRWIFLLLTAVSVAGLLLGLALLRDTGGRERRPLDWGGWALAAAGVITLVLVSRHVPEHGLTPGGLALAAAGAAALAVLVRRSLRRADPLIDFRMFTFPVFTAAMVVIFINALAQYARLTYLPVEFSVVRDMSARDVGLLLSPAAVAVAVTMPLGGWLADRIGSRVPVLAGMVAMAVPTLALARLAPDTPVSWILLVLIVQGLGMGVSMMPTTVAAMNVLPGRFVAQASSVVALNRQISGAVGTAFLAALLVAALGSVSPEGLRTATDIARAQDAYNHVFLTTTCALAAAVVPALFLPGRRRMRRLQLQRAAESDPSGADAPPG